MPEIAAGFVAYRRQQLGVEQETEESLRQVYRGSLSLLYKLLFVLYAEDRGLMPAGETYQKHYAISGLFERLREDEARSILGSFLFKRDDIHKKTAVLSGGEKTRLNLVKFLVNPPNLLLMDEPTTHLDILTVESLVLALEAYEGTLVFISHDVHFIRKLAKRVLHINAGQVNSYPGGYDYFLEKSGLLGSERFALTAE